ncbi:MAG TPA: ester cyclase, partial [Arthrobacter sp.]|nr:ester cyclase [Arthrobacter sp.]
YASLRKTIEAMHTAFPDSSTEILEIIEDGPKVAVHWQTTGTHTGEFMDVPATGRSITVTGASFLTFDGDKLAEEWVVWDPRELLSALGIWHLGAGNA